MSHIKQNFILIAFVMAFISAYTAENKASSVPVDFVFTLDSLSGQKNSMRNLHVNIWINAQGAGRFEYYDNGGTTSYTTDDILTYAPDQVVKSGKFYLTTRELQQLWDTLNQNGFFELDEHYEAQLGLSYAFFLVKGNGKSHSVNNIGVEVPEIRAIIERVNEILPEDMNLLYREGFTP
jgi:hypothetical protein